MLSPGTIVNYHLAVLGYHNSAYCDFGAPNHYGAYFKDICLNWNGECYRQTGIINLLKRRYEFESHGVGVTYPRANTRGNPIYLAFNVGGVETFANDTIRVFAYRYG